MSPSLLSKSDKISFNKDFADIQLTKPISNQLQVNIWYRHLQYLKAVLLADESIIQSTHLCSVECC